MVLLIGAKGRTGRQILAQESSLTFREYDGDMRDEGALTRALKGVDAVLSVVGHVKGSDPDVQTVGTRALIRAMKTSRVKRVVMLTGTGVRMPGDRITIIDRVLNLGVGMVDPARVKDGIDATKELASSDLDYTVLRVLKLTNGDAKAGWQLTASGPTLPFVARADVALALITLLEQNLFVRALPMISRSR